MVCDVYYIPFLFCKILKNKKLNSIIYFVTKRGGLVLIDVEKMRMLKTNNSEMKFKLIKPNIERFFRDYIYYFNIYDRDELIIDSGYLPWHYLDENVINMVINLLEKELGYNIIIMKTTNTSKKGYQKGDLINIRLFDRQNTTIKEVDEYFNMKMYQPLYSSFHNYSNISGIDETPSYLSCLNTSNSYLLEESTNNINNERKL